MSRRRLLIGVACVSAMSLGGGDVMAMSVAQAQQHLRERETALRVAQERYAQGSIPYANVQARQREVNEARAALARAQGGGSSSSQSSNTPSTSQSASSGEVARLQQHLRERETALRVAQERYAQGSIPYANVQARQREVDEARAALARAQGTSGGQSSSSSPANNNSGSSSGSSRNVVHVSNASQLANACRNAGAGTRIVIANGTYSQGGGFEVKANGNASNPIVIEAASRGRATLGSELRIYGGHVRVVGLTMSRATVHVFAPNCSISRCTFSNCGTAISARGANNIEIAYNEIRNWSNRAIDLDPIHGGQAGNNPYVHHNYLGNGAKGVDFAIGVGHQPSDTALRVNARIEYNLIENCNFDQIILMKCSNNNVRYNTLVNCGAIYVRHGRNNLVSENYVINSKGIWLSDVGNEARNNYLDNSQILVLGGDILSSQLQNQTGGFPRAENARLTNNFAHRTEIGRVFSRSSTRLPATGTVVDGHRGRIDRGTEQNTRIGNASSSSAGNGARRISSGQVGPNA